MDAPAAVSRMPLTHGHARKAGSWTVGFRIPKPVAPCGAQKNELSMTMTAIPISAARDLPMIGYTMNSFGEELVSDGRKWSGRTDAANVAGVAGAAEDVPDAADRGG